MRKILGLYSIDIRLQTVRDARVMDHKFVKKVQKVIQTCLFVLTPVVKGASIGAPITVRQTTKSILEFTNLDW